MTPQQNNHKHLNLSTVNAITVFTKPQNRYLGQNKNTAFQPVMASAIPKTLEPFMHSVFGMKAKEKEKKKYINITMPSQINLRSHSYLRDMFVRSHGDKYYSNYD